MSLFRIALVFLMLLGLADRGVLHAQVNPQTGTILTYDNGDGPLVVDYELEIPSTLSVGALKVKISPSKGVSPRDRNLEIVFYASGQAYSPDTSMAVHAKVVLPEGATSSDLTIVAPCVANSFYYSQGSEIEYWDVGVFENGYDIEANQSGRSMGPVLNVRDSFHQFQDSPASSFLLIADDAESAQVSQQRLRKWNAFGLNLSRSQASNPQGAGVGRGMITSVRKNSQTTEDWRSYLPFSAVLIEVANLEQLLASKPQVCRAIKQYVAAGGNVFVFGRTKTPASQIVSAWLSGESQPNEAGKIESAQNVNQARARSPRRVADWEEIRIAELDWWTLDLNTVRGGSDKPSAPVESGRPMGSPQTVLRGMQHDAAILLGTFAEARALPVVDLATSLGELAEPVDDSGMSMLPPVALAPFSASANGMGAPQNWQTPGSGLPMMASMVSNQGPLMLTSMPLIETGFQWESLRSGLQKKWLTSECSGTTYLLGRIVILEADIETTPQEFLTVAQGYLGNAASNQIRLSTDGQWSLKHLIESVGKPPVWVFCGLVLLFGLILGPGLLTLTGIMKRRSLLIFLVPAVSLIATLCIITYEVLHEGFETSLRVTSVVALDGSTNEGMAWSRQTIFAAMPPRQGLTFSTDSFFRAVDASRGDSNRSPSPRNNTRSDVILGEKEIRWQNWLRAREQQQFLLGHPVKMPPPISLVRNEATRLHLENLSDKPLYWVAYRDESGSYFVGSNEEAKGEFSLERIGNESLGGTAARVRADHAPAIPNELMGRSTMTSRRFAFQASDIDVIDAAWNSLLGDNMELPRNSYVVLLPAHAGIQIPIDGTVTQAIQVVTGTLP